MIFLAYDGVMRHNPIVSQEASEVCLKSVGFRGRNLYLYPHKCYMAISFPSFICNVNVVSGGTITS